MSQFPSVPPGAPALPGTPPPPAAPRPKTSGLAIAGLVCGIVGLCPLGLPSLAGIVLSILAMRQISRSGGRLGGRGLAIAGLVVSIVTLFLALFVAAIFGLFFLAEVHVKEAGRAQASMAAMEQLCRAALVYSRMNGDRLPPADQWPSALRQAGVLGPGRLGSVVAEGPRRPYAMNAALDGLRLRDVPRPSETVLFFECDPPGPTCGGPEALPPHPPVGNAYVIGFVDGRVEHVRPEELDRLIWDPKAKAKP